MLTAPNIFHSKIYKKVGALIVLFFLFLGVGFYAYTNSNYYTTHVVVGPKWVNQAQFAGMYVAQSKGIYKRQGLDVSFKEYDVETNQFEDLLSGNTDFALVSAEEFLESVSNGAPITAIAIIYQVSPYTVVSLAANNINTPADFKGKILGNKGGKLESAIFYRLMLNSVGLTEKDVTVKNLGFDMHEYENLLTGTDVIGLYRTDQLYFFEQSGHQYTLINPENYGINGFNDILITRNDMIASNPELVQAFVSSTIEGWEYAIANPKDAVDITLEYVTNPNYLDVDYELFILNKSIPLVKPDQNTRVGSMTFAQWNKLYSQLVQKGFLSADLDITKVYTTEFLR
ncbi:MAG: ABC transporter substrate-binding protein [Patescibacteria group bacterium]|uniref:Thiamine pyrimidine synthase n=1 Tax=candidate division WWE3 bacterium TaxID=2053526 RepID=A0A955J2E2_UNCKA|nr:ABC transporter substrate-binding protein [candidate division WWE3 bacterium]